MRLQYPTRAGTRTSDLALPPHGMLSRGTEPDGPQLLVEGLRVPAGAVLPLTAEMGGSHRAVDVPISTGSLPQYATLTPAATPSAVHRGRPVS